jgi:CheY-like chemotaxis protein
MMRQALLLETDLFFQVKVVDTLKHVGYATRTARRLDEFIRWLGAEHASSDQDSGAEAPMFSAPDIVLVDTAARGVDWQAAIRAARAVGAPVVAFGSHVDLATQEAARQAGATSVIANSKLASDLPGVIERALRKGAAAQE